MATHTTLSGHYRLWLPTLCQPRGVLRYDAAWQADPWNVVDDAGAPWTLATDAKGIVFVRGHHAGPDAVPPADRLLAGRDRRHALAYLVAGPTDHVHPWEEFRPWVGEEEATPRCPGCNGAGRWLECDDCDGDGKDVLPKRPGLLLGVGVNLNLLARFLAGVEPTDLVWLRRWDDPRPARFNSRGRQTASGKGRLEAVAVASFGWSVAVMGCDLKDDERARATEYPFPDARP